MENISETLKGYEYFKKIGQEIKGKNHKASVKPCLSQIIENRPVIVQEKPRVKLNSDWLSEKVLILVDNKDYLPRHKKLAREYGSKYLLKLAELAGTKDKPSCWYAKVTSKKNWQAVTLPMLEKLFKAVENAKKAISKLGMSDKWLRFYTKVAYRTTEAKFFGILEQAQTSAKTTPQYYFRYLVSQV